jgi:hypothetical protein
VSSPIYYSPCTEARKRLDEYGKKHPDLELSEVLDDFVLGRDEPFQIGAVKEAFNPNLSCLPDSEVKRKVENMDTLFTCPDTKKADRLRNLRCLRDLNWKCPNTACRAQLIEWIKEM